MARLNSTGFELNSIALENLASSGASLTIQSTTKNGGVYALKEASPTSGVAHYVQMAYSDAGATSPIWHRFWFYLHTSVDASCTIALLGQFSQNGTRVVLGTDDKLTLVNGSTGTAGMQTIGTSASALAKDTWHCIEVKIDSSGGAGAGVYDMRVNGSSVVSSTTATILTAYYYLSVGSNLHYDSGFSVLDTASSGEFYFDDLAANDSTGSFQNSWCGLGKIVCSRPNGDGDNHGWLYQGGGAGDASSYTSVDEVTPDDATTYLKRTSGQPIDDYAMQGSSDLGIGTSDIISFVSVNLRGGATSATDSTNRYVKSRIKKTASGTVLDSGSGSHKLNVNGWTTNSVDTSTKKFPKLQAYQDPDGADWTPSTIDTMQVGIQPQTSSTTEVRVSAIWAMIEYIPSGPTDYSLACSGGSYSMTGTTASLLAGYSPSLSSGQFTVTAGDPLFEGGASASREIIYNLSNGKIMKRINDGVYMQL